MFRLITKKRPCGWLAAVLAVLILLSAAILPAHAKGTGWYCVRAKNHAQPVADPPLREVEKYGGYYIDHTHTDPKADDKVVYLTFDAGYENGNVVKILDTLKAHNAEGCFFILENLIERNTDLVKRMFDEGHTVGNHTMKHKNMAKYGTRENFETELYGLEKLCRELTGHEMAKIYRPPEGSFTGENLKIVSEMGYKTIFWSYAYADWDNEKQPDPEASLKRLLNHVHNGEILLLHPTSATNAGILDRFLTELEAEGYRFGSIKELCGL